MKLPMHFIDGNDPTTAPDAVFVYPEFDSALKFDPDSGAVVDDETGEVFRIKGLDSEYQSFIAELRGPSQLVCVKGYTGSCQRPGVGRTRAYNITSLEIDGVYVQGDAGSDSISRIARFFNSYAPHGWPKDWVGRAAVVIDNRRYVSAAT